MTTPDDPARPAPRAEPLAPRLLAALSALAEHADEDCPAGHRSRHLGAALEDARALLAEAAAGGIAPAATDAALVAALKAVLPYAENERDSLHECWRRDDDPGLKDELDRCDRALLRAVVLVNRAHAALAGPAAPGGTGDAHRLRRTLEDVAEWIETGKVDGVGFDEAPVLEEVRTVLAEGAPEEPAAALRDLMDQLIGVGLAPERPGDPEDDVGQWAGAEGLSFARARAACGRPAARPPRRSRPGTSPPPAPGSPPRRSAMNSARENLRRAARCDRALRRYDGGGPYHGLVDLLADAMHLCRARGHDFDALLGRAAEHFAAEVRDEPVAVDHRPP